MENQAFGHIREHQKEQKARIFNNYVEGSKKDAGAAEVITKAQMDELYPADQYEHYSLSAVDKFRQELQKAEGIGNPEEAFKAATKDLKHFVLHHEGKKAFVFVRKKEKGE